MWIRAINFLLLASITSWATGAAQFLHEAVEHAQKDDGGAARISADARFGGRTGPGVNDRLLPPPREDRGPNPQHPHDHDDCPTCQMLAHMSAAPVAPPVLICVHLLTFYTAAIADRHWPAVHTHLYIPIRGPPTAGMQSW